MENLSLLEKFQHINDVEYLNFTEDAIYLSRPSQKWRGNAAPTFSSNTDSRSYHWRFVVDGNVAYRLKHNADKFWKIQEKVLASGFEP
jgi:hypothetical protein